MRKVLCLLLFSLLYIPLVWSQAVDEVSFFSEVDTAFQQVQVGREAQVCYLSNRKMEKHTPPVWNAEEVERISGPHAMSSSRAQTVNGNSKVVALQGFYYAVRFLKAGTFRLPVITAVIDGDTHTCEAATIHVLPAEGVEGVVCNLTTEPESPRAGQEFNLILTCNRKPDPQTPTFLHQDIELLSSSGTYTSKNGVREYRYIYKMKVKRPGSYVIAPLDLTFGGVEYPLAAYQLDVTGGNCLWALIIFSLCVGGFLYYCLLFRKEGKEDLANFVFRTGRLNLSISNAMTHYGLSMYAFAMPMCFSGFELYDCFKGTPASHNNPSTLMGIIGVFTLLGVLFAYTQYKKLFFIKVRTSLSIDELYEVIQNVGAEHEWLCEHSGYDCFVGHTPGGFSKMSWGEQVIMVFDQGQVWINSICDLQQRASITSFGRTKKNVRWLIAAIEEAEAEKKKGVCK